MAFAIEWQYLTERSWAARASSRQEPEWPPHPDRVFSALVAAWGERGEDEAERAALEWLERLGPPDVYAPPLAAPESDSLDAAPSTSTVRGSAPGTYVIPNEVASDKKQRDDAAFFGRPLKRRTFPSVLTGTATCALVWPDADPGPYRDALLRLVSEVTYVGTSRSFIRAWLDDTASASGHRWRPSGTTETPDEHLRVAEPGRLAALREDYNGTDADARPRLARQRGYSAVVDDETPGGRFSPELFILRTQAHARTSVSHGPAVVDALRRRLIAVARDSRMDAEAMRLISGHEADGAASRAGHVALAPLPFVGHPHADGHLMGVALAFPNDASEHQRLAVLYALARVLSEGTRTVELSLGAHRVVTLMAEDRDNPPRATRPSTWTAPSDAWATVTPLAPDRHPPRRCADPDAFLRDDLAGACERQGLPRPVEVALLGASRFSGAPHARQYAPLRTKAGSRRRLAHVTIRFAEPVRGPLLLGAGRFRGYGVFRPLRSRAEG
ncbi:MAG: type I-U CRISPR-associated protein Cas5/Cas6 [Myxococcales bacterium]|nr:type I-U CRISPR-associated protein Cas5/Cas6 [Myxococcales bacterium]